MISLQEAKNRIQKNAKGFKRKECVRMHQGVGRVLAKNLYATDNQPNFTNAAMDGYALRCKDTPGRFEIQKMQFAGDAFCKLEVKKAIEIATGAPLPKGANAVVPQEDVVVNNGRVVISQKIILGKNIRTQGENIRKGEKIFSKGHGVCAKDLGLLASFGFGKIPVFQKPRVSYLATGNEIISVGEKKEAHQIFNSNAVSLRGLFEKAGCVFQDFGIRKDVHSLLSKKVQAMLDQKPDFLVLTGGVSVGQKDYVAFVLKDLGAKILFHKVRIKPGKPILCASLGRTLIFGLPGNPLAAQVGFYQFILPAITKMLHVQNRPFISKAKLLKPIAQQKRHLFLPAKMFEALGGVCVDPIEESSGSVKALSCGNCLISIPQGSGALKKNTWVEIQPYD